MRISRDVTFDETRVTPQNRHLADYSDQATIYMMSLWKRPPSIICTSKYTHYAGGIIVATVTQVHDGTHKRIYNNHEDSMSQESKKKIQYKDLKSYIKQIASEYGQEYKWA
jgi:hypothetical protein